jgi:hypothetical protein
VDLNRIIQDLKAECDTLAAAKAPPANAAKKQGTIMASAATQPVG